MKKLLLILLVCISSVLVSSPAYAETVYDDEYYKYFEDEDYDGIGLYKIFILKDNEPVESFDMMKTTTQKLTVRPFPTKANGNVRWYSSNEKIATVDKDGKVTAVGTGTCKIHAVSKISSAKKDTVTVNVTSYVRKADRITIAPEEGSVFETGNKVKFVPTFYPEDTTQKSLRWIVFGNAATIDQNGVLTIHDKGTVKVRAITYDWSKSFDLEIKTMYAKDHFSEIGSAHNVKKDKSIRIEFDNPVDAASARNNIFASVTSDGNGDNIDIDVITDGNVVTIKPKDVWNTGFNYLFIKEGIKDTDGNLLNGNYMYMIQVREG